MGFKKAAIVVCVFALTVNSCLALPALSRFSQLASLLQRLGFGTNNAAGTNNVEQTNNEQAATPTFNTGNTQSSDSSATPFAGDTRLLSIIGSRWEGIENQVEERLENQPEYISEPAERRLEQASDFFERQQEQQLAAQMNNNGWNSFLSNNWNSYDDDVADSRFDALDNRVENRIEFIEDRFGEQVADRLEHRWDTVSNAIENRIDYENEDDYNSSDDANKWYDDRDDYNEDGNSWGNYLNNAWSSSNTQSSNNWHDDAGDDWNEWTY